MDNVDFYSRLMISQISSVFLGVHTALRGVVEHCQLSQNLGSITVLWVSERYKNITAWNANAISPEAAKF